jgi:hypothetical protein
MQNKIQNIEFLIDINSKDIIRLEQILIKDPSNKEVADMIEEKLRVHKLLRKDLIAEGMKSYHNKKH